MSQIRRFIMIDNHKLSPVAAILLPLTLLFTPLRAETISDWNAKAEAIGIEKRILPPANARTMAILHMSMFEAVNAIERRYQPYRLKLTAARATSMEAAAGVAAHDALAALYPDQALQLDAVLGAALDRLPAGDARTKGIAVGKAAAAGILALRDGDGSSASESYRPATAPGVYVPTPLPVSSRDGEMTPWVMTTPSQFRPGPPPALDSATWTKDLNEIRELGGRKSVRRTPEQTDIARFWFITGPQSWNPIVCQLIAAKQLDLTDAARVHALVGAATADAFIAVFDAKHHYNFWRPITAIRNADLTGNKATPRDASWLPLGETPLHPEYPCAHCITSTAVAEILKSVFGNDVAEVTMTSPTAPGVTRRWTRLDDYAEEVALARIYAGFHYRFSDNAARDMGRKIAALTIATQLSKIVTSTDVRQ
jgi:hypothetical protein